MRRLRRTKRVGRTCLCVIAVTAAGGLAWAQSPPEASDATGALEEITVTATRHEESLSKVPISITALNQESLDIRGIKDMQDLAKFTPGVNVDASGTNNVAIRGIASSGGAGTTGIYIDETPIQMRALAFNPDEALPKSFDIDRIEVLRGPQGTLFGAGSEGGTVRYITAQPSLTKSSVYSRSEVAYTQGGDPSYEAGVAAGGPLIDGTLGARATVWYRRDGGWVDRINPITLATEDSKANHVESTVARLAAVWAPAAAWTITPSIYYQDSNRNDGDTYWPLHSSPGSHKFVSANPTGRPAPDTFYLGAVKVEGDLGFARLISNTSYYHRKNTDGYDGTLYDLTFYQAQPQLKITCPVAQPNCVLPVLSLPFINGIPFPLVDATGLHLPAGLTDYRSPASVDNGQQNFTQEIRLQSNDVNARLFWTTGLFYDSNRQSYLEQIHDPMLANLTQTLEGLAITDVFVVGYDPAYPTDSYFLKTAAKDEQLAWFAEGTYRITDELKATVGMRYAKSKYSFDTLTGGPQLFDITRAGSGSKSENSFTPKVDVSYQRDPRNLYYFTYAKGFRPGGANNPVPAVACAADFVNFGLTEAPPTYNSDSVQSFELGAKNNFNNRVRLSSSVYYIKWKDIQQTVVPPICQISFIANLGAAVAKGADIQAEIELTKGLTLDLTAGYTDARYTEDARLTPQEQTPIVASGDSIVGENSTGTNQQPGAPFTASMGLEYKFSAFAHESYLRLDYEHASGPKWAPANQDPRSLQYDAGNFALPPTDFATSTAAMLAVPAPPRITPFAVSANSGLVNTSVIAPKPMMKISK